MNRRELLRIAAASGTAQWLSGNATAAGPIYLADMHYHLFFGGTYNAQKYPLGPDMAGGQATLVAWSLVSDLYGWDRRLTATDKGKSRTRERFMLGSSVRWRESSVMSPTTTLRSSSRQPMLITLFMAIPT